MIGVDEVGRGCWAGPMLVVAARVTGKLPDGLRDSKKLSAKQRQDFQAAIRLTCDLGEGWVSAPEIDRLGLTLATGLGVKRALHAIDASSEEEIIIDGNINYASSQYKNVRCIAKADDLYPAVSAAAIYAKVTRDHYMCHEAHALYPAYSFDKHVGYGTALHLAALKLHGACDMHRLSYKPVAAYSASSI